MTTTSTPTQSSRPRRLKDVHPTRKGLVLAWIGFTATFGFLRALTWAIKVKVAGLGNVDAGGVHLHHYLYGILIMAVVAVLGLLDRDPKWYAWMGLALGIGAALVIDELALLIDLKDVYWDSQGLVSVIVALAFIAGGLLGSLLTIRNSPFKD